MPIETDETGSELLVLKVPILQDVAIHALYAFLQDFLVQFETHYYHRLRRYDRARDAATRDPNEPWKRITPAALNLNPDPDRKIDEDPYDDFPF